MPDFDPKAITDQEDNTVAMQPWSFRKDPRDDSFVVYQCAVRDDIIYRDEVVKDLLRIPPREDGTHEALVRFVTSMPAMMLALQFARIEASLLHTQNCTVSEDETLHPDTCQACAVIAPINAALQEAFGLAVPIGARVKDIEQG